MREEEEGRHRLQLPGDEVEARPREVGELDDARKHFFWVLTSGTHGLRGTRPVTPGARIRAEIALFIESGIAAGEFRPVDVEQVAALGYGVVETAMRHCFVHGEAGAKQAQWERAVFDMLERNVRV